MSGVRHATASDHARMRPWPGLTGMVGWDGEHLLVSDDVPPTVVQLLQGALELLFNPNVLLQEQGMELISSLPEPIRELALTATVARKVEHAHREEQTFLPRFWRISQANLRRLQLLGRTLSDEDIHYVDDDQTIECEVGYLGI